MTISVNYMLLISQIKEFVSCLYNYDAIDVFPFSIKKDILPVVQSLCQDVDYEVRGCMCRQLDPVARGLG